VIDESGDAIFNSNGDKSGEERVRETIERLKEIQCRELRGNIE
jgi:hypothetical protein